jgi:hypothetical protein
VDGLYGKAEEEDSDGQTYKDCCQGVKELAEPPELEGSGCVGDDYVLEVPASAKFYTKVGGYAEGGEQCLDKLLAEGI